MTYQTIQIKRSNTAPSDMRGLLDGELGYVKNTNELFVGTGHGNNPVLINTYSATEKTKLAGIASGAEVNQNAFSNIKVGSTTIAADSKTDTIEIIAGSNITLTPDATNDKITIAAKNAAWSDITDKPSTFAPSPHTHDQYLPLTAGENKKLTGPLGLTEDIMYGPVTPNTGNEFQGQLFFLEDDSYSLPKGGTANQFLIKKSNTDGEAEWKTLTININGDVEGTGTFTGSTLDISTYIDGSKHEHNYLPLTGGVVSGNITANNFIGDLQGQADYAAEANYAETALEAESTKKLASDGKDLNSVDHFYEANILKWGSTHSSFAYGTGNIISMGDNIGYGSQIWFDNANLTNNDIYFRGRTSNLGDASWGPWKQILHSSNYNVYTVTKTGTGASGTWNISILGNANTASKVNNNLTIKLNGGTTEGTNLFTFNGSTAKTINITAAAVGASASGHTHTVTYKKSATATDSSTATGTISAPEFTGTEHNHIFTGEEHNHSLTPTTATIKQVDSVGTMFAASVEGEVLILTPGSAPTTANVTVYTGLTIAAATQGGTIENTIATGTVSAPTFTGTAHTHGITLTDTTVTSST